MTNTIMAVDLGRYKSVVCFYQRDTRTATFRTIDTTPDIVRELCAEQPAALVVVEACANAGWVHDVAIACGLTVKVANTAGEAWKFTHLKRKTDKDDAQRLADSDGWDGSGNARRPNLISDRRVRSPRRTRQRINQC